MSYLYKRLDLTRQRTSLSMEIIQSYIAVAHERYIIWTIDVRP